MEGFRPDGTPGDILKKMLAIMKRVGAIGKDAENKLQHYTFRSCDAVLSKLHPACIEEGVILTPGVRTLEESERINEKGNAVTKATVIMDYTFYAVTDGSFVRASIAGQGIDHSDKAVNKALTACLKYVLCQSFMIPYGEDGDEDSPEMPGKSIGSKRPPGWKPAESSSDTTASTHGPTQRGSGEPEWKVLKEMACPLCGATQCIIRSKQDKSTFYCHECKSGGIDRSAMIGANDDFEARVS